MFDALNAAATGMMAQTKQIETISNNIANADTVGFKKNRAEFQDLLYQNIKEPGAATSATTQNPTGVQIGRGVKVSATSREHGQGSLKGTGRSMDLAINGDGFFAIQKPDGEMAYTRDGSFRMNAEGKLQTSDGYSLVPEITVPRESLGVTIGYDGTVKSTTQNGQSTDLGQIQLTSFANAAGLQAVGQNLYMATEVSGAPVPGNPGEPGLGSIQQGYLEGSNVQPVTEMTDLIKAQRVYELNSKVITSTDQMMSTLNSIK